VPPDTAPHEHANGAGFLPLNRVEALTDGIFAVAMTLLVIELKLPDHGAIHSTHDLHQALADLVFKGVAWINSFFVLSLFWIGHHRVFATVRRVDGRLVALNLLQLGFVSLMPFSSSLAGEYGAQLVSQVIYSINMLLLSLVALLTGRYVHRHPELCGVPMPLGQFRAARIRLSGLALISVVAVLIAAYIQWPAASNIAFMLMMVIGPISRRVERQTNEAALAVAATAHPPSATPRRSHEQQRRSHEHG
jgi:uncharacterized membrane protein